jgi:hypothetical protein
MCVELNVLREMLMQKYGREFSVGVMENGDGVSARVSVQSERTFADRLIGNTGDQQADSGHAVCRACGRVFV